MVPLEELPPTDVAADRLAHEREPPVRCVICGNVADGKSTLIGRLVYRSGLIREGPPSLGPLPVNAHDQLAPRETAYRRFATERREFIVVENPGDEQGTRDLATSASLADCAVLLVDARAGTPVQTRVYGYLASLFGMRHLALAVVNKLDLVDYSGARFREIEAEYRTFGRRVGFEAVTCIPTSALGGDSSYRHHPNHAGGGGPDPGGIAPTRHPRPRLRTSVDRDRHGAGATFTRCRSPEGRSCWDAGRVSHCWRSAIGLHPYSPAPAAQVPA